MSERRSPLVASSGARPPRRQVRGCRPAAPPAVPVQVGKGLTADGYPALGTQTSAEPM